MESLEAFKSFKNDSGTYDIDESSLKEILSKFIKNPKTKTKTKRPPSTYMSWLNANRQTIKETYFGDYDDVETWDDESVTKYFKDKELGEPKQLKKPNMCILISVKAGKLWKELSDEEKAKYKAKPEEPKVDAKPEEPKVDAKPEEPKVDTKPEEPKAKKKQMSKPTKVVKPKEVESTGEEPKADKKVVKKGGKK